MGVVFATWTLTPYPLQFPPPPSLSCCLPLHSPPPKMSRQRFDTSRAASTDNRPCLPNRPFTLVRLCDHLDLFQFDEEDPGRDCVLECGPDKTCYPETCCAVRKKSVKSGDSGSSPPVSTGVRQRSNGSGSGGTATATPFIKTDPTETSSDAVAPTEYPPPEKGLLRVESTPM